MLGLIISSNKSWDCHVEYMLSKVAKRFHCIRYLVRAGVRDIDIIAVYCSVNRSVLEYACPAWHPGLSKNLSNNIERVQKRVMKLIDPTFDYSGSLEKTHLK